MKTLIQIIFAALALLLPSATLQASNNTDFVGQLVKQIEDNPEAYPPSDYEVTTIGPSMIENVIKVLMAGKIANDNINEESQKNLATLLKSVKSLRIFTTNEKGQTYNDVATKLLAQNEKIYKKYDLKKETNPECPAQIWTRQSGHKVVEIVALLPNTDKKKEFDIINVTGNFTNDFMELLVNIDNNNKQ